GVTALVPPLDIACNALPCSFTWLGLVWGFRCQAVFDESTGFVTDAAERSPVHSFNHGHSREAARPLREHRGRDRRSPAAPPRWRCRGGSRAAHRTMRH